MAEIPFTKPQQSAFDIMTKMLGDYGLSSLGATLRKLILSGVTDANQLDLALQQTDEWKIRFAGNEKLRAAGLPVLSVAEYLSVEKSYAQVMKNFGLPQGFYDDPSDFADFIGNSVSSSELQSRAQMYADAAKREDPAVVEQLTAMGMGQGDILAFMMDPDRALPLVQRKSDRRRSAPPGTHPGQRPPRRSRRPGRHRAAGHPGLRSDRGNPRGHNPTGPDVRRVLHPGGCRERGVRQRCRRDRQAEAAGLP